MKTLFTVVFFLLFGSLAYAQIPTCVQALAAKPQGPFPCSVTATWTDNAINETGYVLERRLNGGPWITLGGGPQPANTTSVIDATLQQSATTENVYDYRLKAINSAGETPAPNIPSVIIPMLAGPPKGPTTFTVTFKKATGELDLTPGRKVKLSDDDGKFVISASEITVDLK